MGFLGDLADKAGSFLGGGDDKPKENVDVNKGENMHLGDNDNKHIHNLNANSGSNVKIGGDKDDGNAGGE